MPYITVEMLEGRSLEQKRELVKKITEVVSETIQVSPDKVFIFLEDIKKESYATAGKLLIDQNK